MPLWGDTGAWVDSMSLYNEIELEENRLCERFNSGEISLDEFNREMRELQRDYRAAAEEAAQEAYDNEMRNW